MSHATNRKEGAHGGTRGSPVPNPRAQTAAPASTGSP